MNLLKQSKTRLPQDFVLRNDKKRRIATVVGKHSLAMTDLTGGLLSKKRNLWYKYFIWKISRLC